MREPPGYILPAISPAVDGYISRDLCVIKTATYSSLDGQLWCAWDVRLCLSNILALTTDNYSVLITVSG